jgi:predicted ATP-dependent serine protease
LLALLAKLEWQEMIGNDSSSSNNNKRKTLLVIDSISSIIGHHLSSLTPGAALINQVRLTLRQMARTLDGRLSTSISIRRNHKDLV